ncbi:YlbF family regulator [Paenibacillus allorhizosphaerae]|uniref:YlbF family regulator n=1 Tax=Paenibacillus allorhizosphaerae TaxID=2849866 RepID=A0ABN7TD99_9BACL|nr:YlbF family regulator [Paenibacillus allorhizosphaerae]CAG7622729.1 hypothetical protein PAECIP111802_00862 [Paenibacillus allorhizosphaerae]
MAIMEPQTLDMSAILLGAYELADMIKNSAETADYLYWKERKDQDEEVKRLMPLLNRKKELFEETQRFGHYHPNYHEALDQVNEVMQKLDALESVHHFKEAERKLDELLYEVSQSIAFAVSDTIKVPGNDALASGGGCSTGGSCSGKCG